MDAGEWPVFRYRFGEVTLTRDLMLIPGHRLLLVRYEVRGTAPDTPPVVLRVKPLLAFRNAHDLTRANRALRPETLSAPSGICLRPYEALPPLFMQVEGGFIFNAAPDCCFNVEYLVERERGFAYQEDLFQPGQFEIRLVPGKPVFLTASTEALQTEHGHNVIGEIPRREVERRMGLAASRRVWKAILPGKGAFSCPEARWEAPKRRRATTGSDRGGGIRLSRCPAWFSAPEGPEEGTDVLLGLGSAVRDGLIPNVFSADGNHAYNSADASLWYVWAVQQMLKALPDRKGLVRERCWPVIKNIIEHYGGGKVPFVAPDAEGFLSVGNPGTQLTWMDAVANGRPVTPRHGQPMEISALWYNALAFADSLASVRRTGVAADEAAGRHAVCLFQAVLGHGRAGRLPRGRVARRRRGNVRAPQPAFRPFASLSGSGRGEVCQRAFPRAAVPAYAVRLADAGTERARLSSSV